jgi:hypothetical protein
MKMKEIRQPGIVKVSKKVIKRTSNYLQLLLSDEIDGCGFCC